MTDSVFSPLWYRVAALKPCLRSHIKIHRHHYRGKLWYVLEDSSSGRHYRFAKTAYYIITKMDGKRSIQTIWDDAIENLGDDAPTQDEMIRLFSQLHSVDALLCDVPPDTAELFQRVQTHERMKWKQWVLSPLSLRFPLFDPEQFLNRWVFLIRPLFGWAGVFLWLMVVVPAVILAAIHWPDLSENITDRILTPYNLIIMLVIYPVIKLMHELGHAFSTKVWGGEVHEIGFMLLVFMPVPYVEASSATVFRDKYKRMAVGAAGILVELFLAALALYVWLTVETGLVHTIAYNTMVIGAVSTLLLNGNPLLRFDGYYIFSDAIETPNLGTRSTGYVGYLIQRYLFGLNDAKSPANTAGERFWFIVYGMASFCYRLFIIAVIILVVAGKFFIVGIAIALWAIVTMVCVPVYKKLAFLFNSPVLKKHRARALATSVSLLFAVMLVVFLLPVSLSTRAEGVIWVPPRALVKAGANGFYRKLLVKDDSKVTRNEPLIITEDPLLPAKEKILEYRVQELEAKYYAVNEQDRTQAAIIKEELGTVKSELQRAREKKADLVIKSPANGTFIIPNGKDLDGRFLHKGDLVAYVVDYPLTTVRVVVRQDDIGLVRNRTRSVEVKLADRLDKTYPASIQREVPAASVDLPSAALGYAGGGAVPVDPSDSKGSRAFESVFQFDLSIPDAADVKDIGQRVYVRFDHGKEPLVRHWYRVIRQLLLRRFTV